MLRRIVCNKKKMQSVISILFQFFHPNKLNKTFHSTLFFSIKLNPINQQGCNITRAKERIYIKQAVNSQESKDYMDSDSPPREKKARNNIIEFIWTND